MNHHYNVLPLSSNSNNSSILPTTTNTATIKENRSILGMGNAGHASVTSNNFYNNSSKGFSSYAKSTSSGGGPKKWSKIPTSNTQEI